MRRFRFALLLALSLFLSSSTAHAWNAAGHRLSAVIAWQQMSPGTRDFVTEALSRHPDYHRWQEKAGSGQAIDIFAEASTWPDDIRRDPRFHDKGRNAPPTAQPGLLDNSRHQDWHYVDLGADGRVRAGELDRQIVRLSQLLRSTTDPRQISAILPWLSHLVGDIHQPLHVGRHGDEGGNRVEIENPFNKRLPFSSLHLYWDDLPGPPWLRGKRLHAAAARLLAHYPPPAQGSVALWRDESHRRLATAYPATAGSLLPVITEDFHRQAHDTAGRCLVEAGYRLGRLLDAIHAHRVSRDRP